MFVQEFPLSGITMSKGILTLKHDQTAKLPSKNAEPILFPRKSVESEHILKPCQHLKL